MHFEVLIQTFVRQSIDLLAIIRFFHLCIEFQFSDYIGKKQNKLIFRLLVRFVIVRDVFISLLDVGRGLNLGTLFFVLQVGVL